MAKKKNKSLTRTILVGLGIPTVFFGLDNSKNICKMELYIPNYRDGKIEIIPLEEALKDLPRLLI